MKKDVSIHFTTKAQSIEHLNKLLTTFCEGENYNNPKFDFSEATQPRSVLHHCFLPEETVKEKGFSNEVYETILNPTSEHQICWYGVSGRLGLVWDRMYMLENIKKLNGIALFIGELKEGVLEEFEIAKELGIECIVLDNISTLYIHS